MKKIPRQVERQKEAFLCGCTWIGKQEIFIEQLCKNPSAIRKEKTEDVDFSVFIT